jgi:uncharacterized protein (DUF1697 family)
MKYLALIRGINVGGKNLIRMPDLRASFERAGFTNVTTYIQSGNVLLDSKLRNPAILSAALEQAVARDFGCSSLVVVITQQQLENVVAKTPPGFGSDPDRYRYDVVFLKPPVTAFEVLPSIRLRDGVDGASAGNDVLYFERLTARASQSLFPKIVNLPAYKSMTIRNWNTTRELHRLMMI